MASEQVTLTVKKKLKTLEQTWHGVSYGVQFRETVDYSLYCIKHYRLRYLLSDTTHAKPLTETDLAYCNQTLLKMKQAGLKAFITVAPILPHTHYTLLRIQRHIDEQLTMRVFETRQDAIITIQQLLLDDNEQLSLFN